MTFTWSVSKYPEIKCSAFEWFIFHTYSFFLLFAVLIQVLLKKSYLHLNGLKQLVLLIIEFTEDNLHYILLKWKVACFFIFL